MVITRVASPGLTTGVLLLYFLSFTDIVLLQCHGLPAPLKRYLIPRLSAGITRSVLYIFHMKVFTTIFRRYPNGTTSTWKFGQLPDGRYACKGMETGRKTIFKSLGAYKQRMNYMCWTLGYMQETTRQLTLSLG